MAVFKPKRDEPMALLAALPTAAILVKLLTGILAPYLKEMRHSLSSNLHSASASEGSMSMKTSIVESPIKKKKYFGIAFTIIFFGHFLISSQIISKISSDNCQIRRSL